MKVLVGGEIYHGSGVNFIINAFKSLGIEVVMFNFMEYHPSFLNRVANKLVFKTPHYWQTGEINQELIMQAAQFQPDFTLLFKPILVVPRTVEHLKKISKVFSWYPDYVKFPKTASKLFYEAIPHYDAHFSFNYANSLELQKLGAKVSIFLPCAADPEVHKPPGHLSEEDKKLGADIVFVGTYAPEPRVEYMERLAADGFQVKIYGNDWERLPPDSPLRKTGAVQFKALYLEDMAKVMAASKIVVAFVRKHNDETLACRTYEIPACGAFMLHERTAKTGEVFAEGKEAEFFGSYEELRNKVRYYLDHPEERARIAAAGRAKVLTGGNLFVDRVRKIVEFYKNLGNTRGTDAPVQI